MSELTHCSEADRARSLLRVDPLNPQSKRSLNQVKPQ
jgi:hypothetical protein